MLKKIMLLLIVMLNLLIAQNLNMNFNVNTSIKGVVLDSLSDLPVEYANVIITKANEKDVISGAVTDKDGKFMIKDVTFGKYDLKITFIGYNTKIVKNVVISPKNMAINLNKIYILPKTLVKSEIEVKGQRSLIENHIDKQVVNVEQSPASNGTVIDVLRNTPSVNIDSDNNISVRGKSGVTILIDGKPMLSDNKMLEQMPAGMVDRIEVVTAPSVKYDPEGNSGIINIILKKNNQNNYNGRIFGSASNQEKYSATVNMNYKYNDFNLFGDFAQYKGIGKGNGEMNRQNFNNNSTTYYNGFFKNNYKYNSGSYKIGVDYNFDDFNSITTYFSYDSRIADFNNNGNSRNYINQNILLNTIDFTQKGERNNYDKKYSLFYKHKFDDEGHELTSDFFYNYNNGDDNNNSVYNYSYDPLLNIQKTNTYTDNYYLIYKLDYTNPNFYNGKLESGVNYTYRDKISDYRFLENYQSLDDLSDRNKVSNLFEYIENIGAVYSTYTYSIDTATTFQAGLRYEIVRNNANQKTSAIKFDKNFNDVYPSFYLSRKLNDYNTVKFSYNKRVTRPNLFAINPFKTINRLMINEGNPKLEQVYTHNFELSYNLNYFIAYANVTAYYNYSKGNIERFSTMLNDSVQYTSWINLSKQKNYGLSFGAGGPLAQWLMMNFYVNVFHNQNYGNFYNEDLNSDYTSWNMNYFAMVRLPYEFDLNFSIYYNPGYKSQKVKTPNFTFSYLALKKTFLDKKLTVTLNVSDLFNSMKFVNEQYGSNFNSKMYYKPTTTREISISLTYNLNNFKPIKTRNLDDGRNKENDNMNGGGM